MTAAERYRAFARACMGWADRAKTIEHRENLLNMATAWVEAAARLEHQHALLDRFGAIVSKAKRQLSGSDQAAAINGNGRSKEMESQPKEADGISVAKHKRQLPRETSVE
jgi:uncharacterized protein YeaC (DUF1315 family)